MPRSVAPGRARVELEMDARIIEAARAKAGPGGLSPLVARLLARHCGVEYTPPRGRGRPKKADPPAGDSGPGA